jgi:thioredoxin reductase (NADPH)
MKIYDTIIIGAGPAGLTAALYSGRYKMKTLLLCSLMGGTMTEAHKIWNFPSYEEISGINLTKKMYEQIRLLDIEINNEFTNNVEKKKDGFIITTGKNSYCTKTVIIATGREKAKLNLENEKRFLGKGVHYCAVCDSSFYKDKITAVVGGGNSAINAALLLSEYSKKVYIIYRKSEFIKAEKILIDKVKENKKIEVLFNSNVSELIGKDNLEEIRTDKDKKIKVDGLFIEIGSQPNKDIFQNLDLEYEKDFIKVNNKQETNIPGIYAAGDITSNILKQIITACGEGAVSAYSAYNYINK